MGKFNMYCRVSIELLSKASLSLRKIANDGVDIDVFVT